MATVMLAAASLFAGASASAVAASPELDVPWLTGCTLDTDTANKLRDRLLASNELDNAGGARSPEVAFVIVYSLTYDNDGQPVTVKGTSGYTGAVLCLNSQIAGSESTTQTSGIPKDGGTADFKDLEDAFIIRYQRNDNGDTEKVFCHSAKSNVGCVRVFPNSP